MCRYRVRQILLLLFLLLCLLLFLLLLCLPPLLLSFYCTAAPQLSLALLPVLVACSRLGSARLEVVRAGAPIGDNGNGNGERGHGVPGRLGD